MMNPAKEDYMIGDLFDSPWKLLIVAVVLIVLFGSKKLPDAARSLGKSMRILKTEVRSLHVDEPATETAPPADSTLEQGARLAAAASVEQLGQIAALQQQVRDMRRATATGAAPAGAASEPER
jgi:sec-independent protein translocase protein TatA